MTGLIDQPIRKAYCRDLARKLLKDHAISRLPVPVEKIAQEEGFTIEYIEGESDKFCGILHRKLKAIGINSSHPRVRGRFSIAHELGHFFLEHPQEDDSTDSDEEREEWRICESEANEFAGELLVPKDVLEAQCDKLKNNPIDRVIQTLAGLFEVSRDVLIIQLTKHRLLMKL